MKKSICQILLNVKMLKPQTVDEYVEDLFVIDEVLEKDDTLIIIMQDEPNETIMRHVHHLFNKDVFIVVHSIHRLQANILKHSLVPQMFIMDDSEKTELKKNMNITILSNYQKLAVLTLRHWPCVCDRAMLNLSEIA